MGLFNKGGANKNDVKLAKMELEKIKLEEKKLKKMSKAEKEEYKKKQMQEEVNGYLKYTTLNINQMSSMLNELKIQTTTLVSKVISMEGQKLGFREKGEFRRTKEEAWKNLRYLYLAKDFFVALSKLSTGLPLKLDQSTLIVKFGPYFDGTPVLEISDEDSDDSLFGEFKEMWSEIKEEFVGGSSETQFDLHSYLQERYHSEIEKFIIPDFESAINTFKSTITSNNETPLNNQVVNNTTTSDYVECSNCHAKVNKDSKFCPECGNKIEIKKSGFCSECGTPIPAGAKFCANCGNKVM